jgi:hypothetical protein
MSLIGELYDSKDQEAIKRLYKDDPSFWGLLKKTIGNKIIEEQKKVLMSKPLDVLSLICLTSSFADSEDECHRVAVIVYEYINEEDPLPYVHRDVGIKLSKKALMALSLYNNALERRWRDHGAPRPDFYRNLSIATFNTYGHQDIAAHHRKWEGFIGEFFI